MYRTPVSEMAFTLRHVAGLGDAIAEGTFPNLGDEILDAVLSEAGRFAQDELAPLNRVGDVEGALLQNGVVSTAPGWRDAYRHWREGGWGGVAASEEIGGQGLPLMLSAATQEIWNSACMAFALCPMLTMGAVEALERHGSTALKRTYLRRLVSGEWTATMNLTEPQAGSDLSLLRTRAERHGDGTYRLFGQKIFITYGDHDLAENIVHMVLARLPDAPAGSKGISLFLVPKLLVNDDGSTGARNDLFCASLEHKMGIHGSPTCTMIYGDGRFGEAAGAIGWLVGEENRGLACMFTMMNNARLMVGIQGVGVAERALQQATAFASERKQGRAPRHSGQGMSPIVLHPDVRRMLMEMRALTAASRAICYACAFAADMAAGDRGDAASQAHWRERADLLTPIAKAFATDSAFDVASLGVQVHGGMGFIEETGAAQLLRDSRISSIYEGTNGIQAIDLVMRKLPLSGGAAVRGFIKELKEIVEHVRKENQSAFGQMGIRLSAALDDLAAATDYLLSALEASRTEEALAGATPYLKLFALAAGGTLLAKGALAARDGTGEAARFIATARFFAERLAPQTAGLRESVMAGADALLSAPAIAVDA